MQQNITGTVSVVLVGEEQGTIASQRKNEILLSFEGVAGDRHIGYTRKSGVREKDYYQRGTIIRNNRQLSIVSEEELSFVAKELHCEKILPELLGANICIKGVPDFSSISGLTRLVFPSGATIIIYGENLPCIYPGKIIEEHIPAVSAPLFPKAAMHKRGLVGWVEAEGIIHEGDAVILQ